MAYYNATIQQKEEDYEALASKIASDTKKLTALGCDIQQMVSDWGRIEPEYDIFMADDDWDPMDNALTMEELLDPDQVERELAKRRQA